MNNTRTIYRLAFLVSLIFLASCNSQEPKNIDRLFFPFYSRIYSYNPHDTNLEEFKKSPYQFTRYYYQNNQNIWLSSKNNSTGQKELILFDASSKSFKTIKSGNYLEIIPLKSCVFFMFNSLIPDSGLPYEIYKYKENTIESNAFMQGQIDYIISDVQSIDNGILIGGSDIEDSTNSIYHFNLEKQKARSIFNVPKNKDFIKLVKFKKNIFCYLSQQKWQEKSNPRLWYTSETSLEESDNIQWSNYSNSFAEDFSNFSFFGKGFSSKDRLFIPLITKENTCSLLIFNPFQVDREIDFFPLATGLYSPIIKESLASSGNYYFIGYNYYQDQSRFRFLHFELLAEHNKLAIKSIQDLYF